MSPAGVDDRLVKSIERASEGDRTVREFLSDLIFEEAERLGRWRWKKAYREKLAARAQEWGGNDAN